MGLRKTSYPLGRAIFDPVALMWTILVEFHDIELRALENQKIAGLDRK